MRRRDIPMIVAAAAAGAVLPGRRAEAQTCTAPCYARTAAEITAGVTPANYAYPFGHVLRYGMVEGISLPSDVNTPIWTSMMSVAAANGGMVAYFPLGNWRGNFFVNTSNVYLVGEGGVGESNQSCLRPYQTGSGKITLRYSNGTRQNERGGIQRLLVSGNDGSGNMAEVALLLDGGTVHFAAENFEIIDGVRSLHIEGSGGYPVTTCFFDQWHIRNAGSDSASRAIYMRRPADPNYVTAIFFSQGHVNGPSGGFWLELNGTSGPGITAHFSQVYVDSKPGCGVRYAAGNETLYCQDVQLDPGNVNRQILDRGDTSYNPGNSLLGTMHHGGQQIRYSNATLTNIPNECDTFAKKAWFGEVWMNLPLHFTNVSAANQPFDETNALPFLDSDSAVGPITLNRASLSIKTEGQGLRVKEGFNCRQGVVTLGSGTSVVNNTTVTASSRILLTVQSLGTVTSPKAVAVVARVPGSTFTIQSGDPTDTSVVAYEIFEPA